MIKIIDGDNEVELTADEMDALFSAAEDTSEENPTWASSHSLLDKLRTIYHMPGSDSHRR